VTVLLNWLFVKITKLTTVTGVGGASLQMVSKSGLYSPVDDDRSLSWTASPSWYTLPASIRGFQSTYLLGSERVRCRKRA